MRTIAVNFFGGPGAGKSTLAAMVFSKLKQIGISCELVTEYAKEVIWEEAYRTLEDQLFVFAKQCHKQEVLMEKVNVIITDSPILQSVVYNADKTSETFKQLVLERFNSFNNINYFKVRQEFFEELGRIHDIDEAILLDRLIHNSLLDYQINFQYITEITEYHLTIILNTIMGRLKEIA